MIASTNHFLFMAILAHDITGSASAVRWLDVRLRAAPNEARSRALQVSTVQF